MPAFFQAGSIGFEHPFDLVAHAPELIENLLFRRRGVRIIEAPVIPPVELSPRTCVAGFSLTPFGLVDPFRVGRAQSSLRDGNSGEPPYRIQREYAFRQPDQRRRARVRQPHRESGR